MDYAESKGISEKKNLCFINYAKAFDCVNHNKLSWSDGKLLERWEYQTILPVSWEICYVGQEATVRTPCRTTDSFKIEKGDYRDVCCHPVCLIYTEHIMRMAGLNELHAGIKIGGRNLNNFRYADDTTLMAESKEEYLDES